MAHLVNVVWYQRCIWNVVFDFQMLLSWHWGWGWPKGLFLKLFSIIFFCKIIPYDFVWKDITTIWDSISLLLDTIDFHGLRWYWIRYTKKRIDKFTSGSCSCTLRLAFGIQRWRRWRTRWRSRCWGRCRLSCRSCSPSRTLASPVLGMTSFVWQKLMLQFW